MSSGSSEASLGPSASRGSLAALGPLTRPIVVGGRRLPSIGLLVLAAIGAMLLVVVATTSWQAGSDELAYWRAAGRLAAGQPLYDPAALPNTPYAFWNPPPIAQVLAPFTGLLSPEAFTAIWTALLLVCLWWLGGRSVVVALALVAFLPVAVELRTRNMHLLLAALTVLALRRSWVFWVVATALKVSPVLGPIYLVVAGRWREAVKVAVVGLAVLAVSVAVSPGAWSDFLGIVVSGRASSEGGALVAVPFLVRFAIGVGVAVFAGWITFRSRTGRSLRLGGWALGERAGEILLVVALTVANPTLWATALSLLVAIVPLARTRPGARSVGTELASDLRTDPAAPPSGASPAETRI